MRDENIEKDFESTIKHEYFEKCFVGKIGRSGYDLECSIQIYQRRVNNKYDGSTLWLCDFEKNFFLDLDKIIEVADKLGIIEEYLNKKELNKNK